MKIFLGRTAYRAFALIAGIIVGLTASVSTAVEPFADIQQAGRTINPTVRVLLRRLNITNRMDITLSSAYGLTTSKGAELYFAGDSQLSFQLKAGQIYLYYEGVSMNAGTEVFLTRYTDAGADEIGFRQTNYNPLYIGDLRIGVLEDALRPVLSLHVEDYLLGVVPYEMSDSFPLEALKAQTIAARTYVLRKQSSDGEYDVVDTTNDQVFKGYQPGFAQAEKAIAETYGVCGFYKGQLAQCYYAASNGGQTELVGTVWPTEDDFSYYTSVEDPYDVENPSSVVRRATLKKRYTNEGDDYASYGLRRLLANVLSDELTAIGYDPAPESIMVHEVGDVALSDPLSADNLKLLGTLHMTVKISGRTRTEGQAVPTEPERNAEDMDTEEVSLFGNDFPVSTLAPSPTPSSMPEAELTPAPTPIPTPIPVYGEFTQVPESLSLDISIFPVAENALGMNISSNYDNELWTLRETDTEYVLEARRYGHGVGMSQRGAEWMAGVYQMTYQEILGFYYPGMTLMRFDEAATPLESPEDALSATAGPAPTPTPRPTLMPATLAATDGQWYATVTGIDDDSTLNLRSLPDLSGDILMRLYKNQRLLVMERCQEAGWVKVATDAAVGYVMESYLTAE